MSKYEIEKFIYGETEFPPVSKEEMLADINYLMKFLESIKTHLNTTLPFRTKVLDGIINDIQETIALKNNIDNVE